MQYVVGAGRPMGILFTSAHRDMGNNKQPGAHLRTG
jgi:hypothetical protein